MDREADMRIVRSLFLWFYSLSIPGAILLVGLATLCFLCLQMKYQQSPFWKTAVWGGILAWICIVISMTVQERTAGEFQPGPMLIPFYSYAAVFRGATTEILRSNFMNVLLFYPVGLLMRAAFARGRRQRQRIVLIVVLCAAISAGIEFCQYNYSLGVAETDDVIHNTLGALLGVLACGISLDKFIHR